MAKAAASPLLSPTPFAGSYAPEDCLFLLTPLPPRYVPVAEKERLIQTGTRHYSEMLAEETAPTAAYTSLFVHLTHRYKARLAGEILGLAGYLANTRATPLTLVSLARAGTPIGALLKRALACLGIAAPHYSLSIIRERGIDERALAFLLREQAHPGEGVVFVDGWTAKGTITRELKGAIAAWNQTQPEKLPDTLYVVSDIGGTADIAVSCEDYVIPSGIMNATVSGLVSRSVLNEQIPPGAFHGCVFYAHLHPYDLSTWFLDTVSAELAHVAPARVAEFPRQERRRIVQGYLEHLKARYQILDSNRIKPGIAEATRVLLRRVPDRLLLRDPDDPDVAHLRLLAQQKAVLVEEKKDMPFHAVALIREVQNK
jgi:hypothetical protein